MSYTFVTSYIDLTKFDDASKEIKNRNKDYYFDHSHQTMNYNYNLVVYCEKENLEDIKKLRPEYLQEKTKYKIVDFDKMEIGNINFSYLREKIKKNRLTFSSPDPRNTPSYYLFCMMRYIIILDAIKTNYFNSEYFAWINFCISRMGSGIKYLEDVIKEKREKFSTCYIDYCPRYIIDNDLNFWKGRCTMCSGFFTGNIKYMTIFCEEIQKIFISKLNDGLGHADEQLYSLVYFNNPDIFDFYFGDYTEMITNYSKIRERGEEIIKNFIKNSYVYEPMLCKKAIEKLRESHNNKLYSLQPLYLKYLDYFETKI